MKPHTALSPEEALTAILTEVRPLPEETVSLAESLYRVLARPLPARVEDPRFDKSAMDGIAVLREDDSREFEIVAEIAAGDSRDYLLRPGQAARIMTGARVPPGTGRVIMFEDCRFEGSRAVVTRDSGATNIALRGECIVPGQPLLPPRRITPADIGVLASQGYHAVPVRRRPRVAVIATGDEIFPAGEELPPAGIYDSNSHQLSAFARDASAEVRNVGIIRDSLEGIRTALIDATRESDVVILSGGVSMGDLDFVPEALEDIGAETVFHGLAMKPGRPTLYAVLHRSSEADNAAGSAPCRIFGLPGNPVSTAVQFEMLVRPLLVALSGEPWRPREERLPLADDFRRRNADRCEFLPATVRDGEVVRLPYTGSGHISVLAETTAFFRVDRGVSELARGSEVHVRFLR